MHSASDISRGRLQALCSAAYLSLPDDQLRKQRSFPGQEPSGSMDWVGCGKVSYGRRTMEPSWDKVSQGEINAASDPLCEHGEIAVEAGVGKSVASGVQFRSSMLSGTAMNTRRILSV